MPFCLDCPKRQDCKEICPELEKILPKERSGGHKKEISVDPNIFDKLLPEISKIKNRLGIRKHKKIKYNDNWETEQS